LTAAEAIFYLFAVLTIGAAIGVVTVPNVVHSALFLILSLLGVAAFYILLASEFLALVQILIYGGAVATIILFGLMLTRGRDLLPVAPSGPQAPLALLVGIVLAVTFIVGIAQTDWPRDVGEVTAIDVGAISSVLFRQWLLPFEIVGVVLLVALVGAIVISRQEEGEA
jgi:NADH:ubiquinone oxidoreductase subunit 6 (subunit J)